MTHFFLIEFLIKHPKVAAVFSLVCVTLCGVSSLLTGLDAVNAPSEPERLSITAAAHKAYENPGANLWVIIDGGEWDCHTIRYYDVGDETHTDVFLVDNSKQIIILATFTKQLSCDEIQEQQITGFLRSMQDRRLEIFKRDFQSELAAYENANQLLDLCTTCSKGNSLGLSIVFGLVGLGASIVWPLVIWENNRRAREAAELEASQQPWGSNPKSQQ